MVSRNDSRQPGKASPRFLRQRNTPKQICT
jgi:hypothetical protein